MMRRTTRSIAVATPQLRLEFHANLRGFGVSVVDCTPQELVYATIVGVRIRVRSDAATKTTSAHLSVGRVQIDNQLFTTPYPSLCARIDAAAAAGGRRGAGHRVSRD